MNLAQLRQYVTSRVVVDDVDDLDLWLNQAYEDILVRSKAKVSVADMTTTSGELDYELDANILRVLSVTGTDGRTLEQVSDLEMLRFRRGDSSGLAGTYALAGANLLMLWPQPDTTETITIYYVKRPTALAATGDSPDDLPAEFHRLIGLGALAEAADADDDAGTGGGTLYLGRYEDGLVKLKASLNAKGGMRRPRAVVGRARYARADDVYP